jgi:coproporphyrinogen III oxidase-like Fe-S oxidoreductase
MWGADLEYIQREFGPTFKEHCQQQAKPFLHSGRMKKDGKKLILSEEGMFIADYIIVALFLAKD